MIAVDSSALVAVVLGEPDAERFLNALVAGPARLSCVSLVEAGMVVEARQGSDAARDLTILVDGTIEMLVPVDADHASAAINGWRKFGKGNHPAGLNFGDCFAYACAKDSGISLLFKGNDFSQTDVERA